MREFIIGILYLISAVCFILALRGLSSPVHARRGNTLGIIGMVLVVITTFILPQVNNVIPVVEALVIGGIIGAFIAYRIHMKQLPQLIAAFHSLVGLAAACIAISTFYNPASFKIGEIGNIEIRSLIELSIGLAIGAVTFTGSVIAFLKLQGWMTGNPIVLPFHNWLNLVLGIILLILVVLLCITNSYFVLWLIAIVSLLFGFLLIIPIGGADMPVIVSMLNSYSGWATAGIGFTLKNPVLVIVGALVGASGAILSYIMCKGMNRSLLSILIGTSSPVSDKQNTNKQKVTRPYKQGSGEDAAFVMKNSSSVIIVPGYGMAVAQAQHVVKEMADKLKAAGVNVKYAIHPVAGRMPGHMNVLLAEANIPYDEVFEMEAINNDFANTDVVYVIGANDVTNPAAKDDPSSPIYGMPILEVEKAQTVFFVKRTMGTGYSGIDNELFYHDKTIMLLDDAKAITESIVHFLDKV